MVTRPPAVLDAPVSSGAAPAPAPPRGAEFVTVDLSLDAGVPARVPLDGDRTLVLAVPLGVARSLLASDPLAVAADTAEGGLAPDADRGRDPARAWPRLTLLVGGEIGDTVAAVTGAPTVLGRGGVAAVELVLERLVVTAGSLRSPGQYGSRVTLRWRDLHTAPDAGPAPATGDPSIPRRSQRLRLLRGFSLRRAGIGGPLHTDHDGGR
jgi:hypothetical protein